MQLTINPAFRDLLDIPSDAELKELERQLVRDNGPRDPITVWKDHDKTIVDGHNRYKICVAHNLPFEISEREFADETAVEEWILENQLGRRNLSPARAMYFLGLLYNKKKQTPATTAPLPDGKTTAEALGEQFGVNERTVRRAGDEAKGIDTIGKVLGLDSVKAKLDAMKNKSEGAFTKAELAEIGKVKDDNIAEEAAKILVRQKKEEAKQKQAIAPVVQKPAAPKKMSYSVVFSKPAFDRIGYSASTEDRPNLTENCMLYMSVPDEELMKGIELMKRWGLNYEASFVFKTDTHEGLWSDISHTFLLVGGKGTMAGPKKACGSILDSKDGIDQSMIKLVEKYHPNAKKLDMRRNVTAEGWDSITKP